MCAKVGSFAVRHPLTDVELRYLGMIVALNYYYENINRTKNVKTILASTGLRRVGRYARHLGAGNCQPDIKPASVKAPCKLAFALYAVSRCCLGHECAGPG